MTLEDIKATWKLEEMTLEDIKATWKLVKIIRPLLGKSEEEIPLFKALMNNFSLGVNDNGEVVLLNTSDD